jgi:hypothetical protein
MTEPTAADIKSLAVGTAILVDGKRFKVAAQFGNFTTLAGPRGGWANLVPSTDGARVQLTRHTSDARSWVKTIEEG